MQVKTRPKQLFVKSNPNSTQSNFNEPNLPIAKLQSKASLVSQAAANKGRSAQGSQMYSDNQLMSTVFSRQANGHMKAASPSGIEQKLSFDSQSNGLVLSAGRLGSGGVYRQSAPSG